jgi:CRP-like cAMP-binding protein
MSAFGMKADDDLQALLCSYATRLVKRKAADRIFREGEESRGFYLVKQGKLKLFMGPEQGKKVANRLAGPGCLVGLPATVSGHPYSLTCDVVEDAELAYLSLADFSKLMTHEPEAAMQLLKLLSTEVQTIRSEIARTSARKAAATR